MPPSKASWLACESYSWERLSPRLGRLLTRHWTTRQSRPVFSVVVPTYERHTHLPKLLDCLAAQTFRDFEVILVDQSAARWNIPGRYSSLDILYEHTDLKGASRARTGFAMRRATSKNQESSAWRASWSPNASTTRTSGR